MKHYTKSWIRTVFLYFVFCGLGALIVLASRNGRNDDPGNDGFLVHKATMKNPDRGDSWLYFIGACDASATWVVGVNKGSLVYDAGTNKLLHDLPVPMARGALSENGVLALGNYDQLWLFSAKTGREMAYFKGTGEAPLSLLYAEATRSVFYGCHTGAIGRMNTIDNKHSVVFNGHDGAVWALAELPGEIASAGDDGIRFWKNGTWKANTVLRAKSPVFSLAVSGNKKTLASGTRDGTISWWDVQSRTKLGQLEGHGGKITALVFVDDDRYLLSAGVDRTLRLWDLRQKKEIAREKRRIVWIQHMGVLRSRNLVILAVAGEIETWQVNLPDKNKDE